MKLLLDTHTIVHHSARSSFFPERIYEQIDAAENEVFISAVSAGEIACLARINRLNLKQPWDIWLKETIAENEWQCVPITLEIMVEAYSLPQPVHKDPADLLLMATARMHGLILVTADRLMRQYPHVTTLS